MCARHVAYGLQVDAAFPLPGMRGAACETLPSLTLDAVSPQTLATAWSGSDELPMWEGRLGDGCSLTIDHGNARDVMFRYGDRAIFRLDGSHERLECAPLQEGLHWQQVLLARVLPDVAIIRGYEALHASAVASTDGVVAILAPSGVGKTTLALELLKRGWSLFADDVLTLAPADQAPAVTAHPGTPHVNIAPVRRDGSPAPDATELGATLGTLAGERWIAVERTARESSTVRMLCILERGESPSPQLSALPRSPLALAPYMLVLGGDAERERRRFACYSDLVSTASLVRLTCAPDTPPGELAELLEGALEARQPVVGAMR